MATYISLLHFTDQGIRNIKDGTRRLDGVKKAFASMGGEIKEFYSTMGAYDAVVVMDAPDDQTAAKLILSVGAQGNVRGETLRAFGETEYRKILASLP